MAAPQSHFVGVSPAGEFIYERGGKRFVVPASIAVPAMPRWQEKGFADEASYVRFLQGQESDVLARHDAPRPKATATAASRAPVRSRQVADPPARRAPVRDVSQAMGYGGAAMAGMGLGVDETLRRVSPWNILAKR